MSRIPCIYSLQQRLQFTREQTTRNSSLHVIQTLAMGSKYRYKLLLFRHDQTRTDTARDQIKPNFPNCSLHFAELQFTASPEPKCVMFSIRMHEGSCPAVHRRPIASAAAINALIFKSRITVYIWCDKKILHVCLENSLDRISRMDLLPLFSKS